jgi:hypothetical protein
MLRIKQIVALLLVLLTACELPRANRPQPPPTAGARNPSTPLIAPTRSLATATPPALTARAQTMYQAVGELLRLHQQHNRQLPERVDCFLQRAIAQV